MKDNLFTEESTRAKMLTGIKKVAEAVGKTMGTAGANGIIETMERPGYFLTNDGYSIANAIVLADPIERLGHRILLESINRANKQSGDGSSTTCVLTAAILEEGMKHIGTVPPMELKTSLEACIPLIEASIASQKKTITVDEIKAVASISAEDEEIGALIQEIYQKIGKEGIIHWDVSKTTEDSYSIGTGITIDGATYMSPYMCDIDEKGALTSSLRWKETSVLLLRQKVTSAMDFEKLFQTLFSSSVRELVIFCEEIEPPVIADLIRTRAVRGFKTVAIKMPVLWREEWWEDLAIATGGNIISTQSGRPLQKATPEDLGGVKYITVTKDSTYLEGVNDLGKHIMGLKVDGSDAALLRAARINTNTARYFVGGHSESALAYRRLKVEDAINSAACALENGVVAGGGVSLANINLEADTVGTHILNFALTAPFATILKNAGIDGKIIPRNKGIDTRSGKIVDMFEANIVDAADVVLNAAKNAIGVAASILTAGSIITIPEQDQTNAPAIPQV
jgi:chaperonin GroEL